MLFAAALEAAPKMAKNRCKRAPKAVLKLPDLEQSKSAVMNSLTSASSKRSYDHAIREFIDCGLRRSELTTLRFEDFQLREGHWVIADLRGKGGHIRTIPVPQWVKEAVDMWTLGAGIDAGPLLRSINKAGRIWGRGFTPKVIWAIVKANATSCGLPSLAPHDLRRTHARLSHHPGGQLDHLP